MLTATLYLSMAVYFWNIFWIVELGTWTASGRLGLFAITLISILVDVLLKEMLSD